MPPNRFRPLRSRLRRELRERIPSRAVERTARALQRYYCGSIVSLMPRGNPAAKLAISVDRDVHAKVLKAAEAEGVSVSAWMTAAARRALRLRDGLAGVAEWEAEHGPLTQAELDAARHRIVKRSRPGQTSKR